MIKWLSVLVFLFVSCQTPKVKEVPPSEFSHLMDIFFEDLWKAYPSWAMREGHPDYQAVLAVPNAASFENQAQFIKKYQEILTKVDKTKLSIPEQGDFVLIKGFLDSSKWRLEVFKEHTWNPALYTVADSFSKILESPSQTDEQKFKAISAKLPLVEAYYEAVRSNIRNPTKEHTELALHQHAGLIKYFDTEFKLYLNKAKISSALKDEVNAGLEKAMAALTKHVAWLDQVLKKPKSVGGFRSFRIGREKFQAKFAHDIQSRFTSDQVYKMALKESAEASQKLVQRAHLLWPKYFGDKEMPRNKMLLVKQVISKVAENHTKPEDFIQTVREIIPRLNDFVTKKNLLTLDPKQPLKVRETPLYERAHYGASVDEPGLFDPKRETFYNVTPLTGMPPEEQESTLREYNNYTLHILNIHEAVPGHYVQLLYGRKNPSKVKRLFGNGAMIEGWAVYAERMMMEAGYMDSQDELWLMYYKWYLRVVTNALMDHGIQARKMTEKQALTMMYDTAFQETAEATKKWKRAKTSQVQLSSYFTGFMEIMELREEIKKKKGKDFSLKEFHEQFLSYGNIPVPMIRKLMLGEAIL